MYGQAAPGDQEIIDALPNLKLIALGSVGVDLVDIAAATARGIPVTNFPTRSSRRSPTTR